MKKKIKITLALMLITIFTICAFQIPTTIKKNQSDEKIESEDQPNEKIIDKSSFDEPVQPKTANPGNSEQEYNFSIETNIEEQWNKTWSHENLEANKDEFGAVMWQYDTTGNNVSFTLKITDLRNSTSLLNELIYPSDLTSMSVVFLNDSEFNWGLIQDNGLGCGIFEGYMIINETIDGVFLIDADVWTEPTNVTFNATVSFSSIKNITVKTNFIPTIENTKSDYILWELKYNNSFYPSIPSDCDYKGILDIDENFTLSTALGYDSGYWVPVDSVRTPKNLTIYGYYEKYKVELMTLNYISITYNNNLTSSKRELNLYTTCKMAGNLTIRFKITNGTVIELNDTVVENEIVTFNFTMPLNASGGVGSLNVTLINETSSFFGVKIAEVLFYKQAIMGGYTSNTTAFSELLILAAYLDDDAINWWGYRNHTENLGLTQEELFNKSMILNASFTYELEGYIGYLEFGYIEYLGMSLYYKSVDLTELQLVPGEYNVTLRANKLGYKSIEFVSPIVIFKRNVYIEIVSISDILTIEEPFSISVNLYVSLPYPPYYENFLRVPVNLSFSIINEDTGLLEDEFMATQIVQSITLQDVIGNDTLPGNYLINITIESEYYEGNTTYTAEIVKKNLDISLDYDTEVEEGEEFEIEWELEGGNFEGNRENMTLIIYIDGDKYDEISLNPKSSGGIELELDEGDHEILFFLDSPFYSAEEEIEIEAVEEEGEEEEEELLEPSWIEQNWLWLLIVIIILIGISTFAMMMLYSRHKIKIQKGLESKLNDLKKDISYKEKQISRIEKQISQIAGIYWILVVHSEQGTTMVEITDLKFREVLGHKYQEIVRERIVRDSALIGGFLTAIRNFGRETAGTVKEYQPIFSSETDYRTIIDDKEIHRRILEGTGYFMAFISSRGTDEVSNILSEVNSKFNEKYNKEVREFKGNISVFKPFKEEVVNFFHSKIKELQNELEKSNIDLDEYEKKLKKVNEKIEIKAEKLHKIKLFKRK